jgi:hypothetical protein
MTILFHDEGEACQIWCEVDEISRGKDGIRSKGGIPKGFPTERKMNRFRSHLMSRRRESRLTFAIWWRRLITNCAVKRECLVIGTLDWRDKLHCDIYLSLLLSLSASFYLASFSHPLEFPVHQQEFSKEKEGFSSILFEMRRKMFAFSLFRVTSMWIHSSNKLESEVANKICK